jgi:hypothetical protein
MAEKDTKPNGGAPAPPTDPDEEFFSAEGISDPEERNAIRSRARVLAYHEWRKKKQEEETKGSKRKGSSKPWYHND